jgi:UTP--glucose-1-phosphate uridylyltransferase
MRFQTVIQPEQLGLGHAVLCGRNALRPGPFVLALGDCVMGLGGESRTTAKIVEVFESKKADAVIAFQRVPVERVSRYGIAIPGNEVDPCDSRRSGFRLKGIVEKPPRDLAPSQFAVSARYVFSDSIFPILERVREDSSGEIQLTSAIQQLIGQGGKVIGVTLQDGEERFDVGDYDSWAAGFIRFAMKENPKLAKLFRDGPEPGVAPE